MLPMPSDPITGLPRTTVEAGFRHSREDFPAIPLHQPAWSRWRWDFDLKSSVPITAVLFLDFGPERSWVRIGREPAMLQLPLRFEIEPFDRRNRSIGEARLRVRRQIHGEGNGIQRAVEHPRLLEDPVPMVRTSLADGEKVSTGDFLELLRLDVAGDLRASLLMLPTEATRGGRTGTWRLRIPLPNTHPEWLAALRGGRRTGSCSRPSS
jgi:hypothetical protein